MPEELWTEVRDIVQETGIKTIPKKKKCKKAKWLSVEALQITVKRREVKSKGEKDISPISINLFPFFRLLRYSFTYPPVYEITDTKK